MKIECQINIYVKAFSSKAEDQLMPSDLNMKYYSDLFVSHKMGQRNIKNAFMYWLTMGKKYQLYLLKNGKRIITIMFLIY